MKNALLVLGLSSLAQLGFAQGEEAEQYRSECCSCCCEPCQKEINCVCYTPMYYDLKCDCGFFVSADFLYWYARDTNLPFAVKTKTLFSNFTNMGQTPGFVAAPRNFEYMKAAWDPGVRVALGYNSSCDGWDYQIDWTYYRNTESKSKSVLPFTSHIAPENGESLTNMWVNALGPLPAIFQFEKVKANYKFRINQLDFELGRRFWLSNCFTVRPYGAVRAAWTDVDFKTLSTHAALQTNTDPAQFLSLNFKDRFDQDYWGAGLLGGFQPNWYFTPCFSLFGNADIALLWGEFDTNKREKYLINRVTSAGESLSSFANYKNKTKLDVSGMQAILDLAIGLRYENTYCDCQYRFSLDLGWEHHIWFSHSHRYQLTYYNSLTLQNGDTVTESIALDTDHDTVFGGFVLRARFDF